ncbi:MAG TPA: PatB family C-S lyase [Anaerolineae bacterium]|nr:PatB family C-S lyase [Anaerolineae bacterium]
MIYNFDEVVERCSTDAAKWSIYDAETLPLWVADMDFVSPEPVIRALHERVNHQIFGYSLPPQELAEIVCDRMHRLYRWSVAPEEILYVPGIVAGINIVARAVARPGEGMLVQTPVYPPFLTAPGNQGLDLQMAELSLVRQDQTVHYELDDEVFHEAITPETRLFVLCNPHNPIGRGYTEEELSRMAAICLKHNLTVCSDEIHADLLLGDTSHIPMATLAPEISKRCVTLIAPSKTYNIPGLKCGMAIIQDPALRRTVQAAMGGLDHTVNIFGFIGALAAYLEGDDWLRQVLAYLTANRDYLIRYLHDQLPGIATTFPQATYLAWLDCQNLGITGSPFDFFLTQAKVALNDGKTFGPGGEGFVRLNFGCPRSTLTEALDRMKTAVQAL